MSKLGYKKIINYCRIQHTTIFFKKKISSPHLFYRVKRTDDIILLVFAFALFFYALNITFSELKDFVTEKVQSAARTKFPRNENRN